MRSSKGFFLFLIILSCPARSEDFSHQPWMETSISFWKKIYTQIPSQRGVLHDVRLVGVEYEVLDFSGLTFRQKQKLIDDARARWMVRLKQIVKWSSSGEPQWVSKLSNEERDFYFRVKPIIHHPSRLLRLATVRRMRVQMGLSDRFEAAIKKSGRYLPMMERVFTAQALPLELTRLPLVESGFHPHAKSHVGAMGLWQFMPQTGREFLKIEATQDQRSDPFWSTQGAAVYLKKLHAEFKTWPLTLMAYQYGPGGVRRAINRLKTDDYRTVWFLNQDLNFGFASRNYYFAFLAALEVDKNAEIYFGSIQKEAPVSYESLVLEKKMHLSDFSKSIQITVKTITQHNPGISREVILGLRPLPKGFRIKLPRCWDLAKGLCE